MLDLFAEAEAEPTSVPGSAPDLFPARTRTTEVAGWIKEYVGATPPQGRPAPLPVLNQVAGDGHHYRPAVFRLGPGVTVGIYPLSGCRGVRVPGERELISLYDATKRELAVQVADQEASHAVIY